VLDADQVHADPAVWDALGLRGNQSGPLTVSDAFVPADRMVGEPGDGAYLNDEAVDPWFLIGSAAVWNGIALGAIDIAKRHTTARRHADVGLRVADYPTIQDLVGESLMDTNAARVLTLAVARAMDDVTEGNRRRLAPGERARANLLHWAWQAKFVAARNATTVVDAMLHACGGSGYRRDMELERYLRDAKAGWLMAPTNEVLRQFVGRAALLGFDALDYWNQHFNAHAVDNEVRKLDATGKRALAERLLREAQASDGG
jgi:alkylation response protein AidB-like acyl-CoA dehydrogenase